jgi:hypothetical protein
VPISYQGSEVDTFDPAEVTPESAADSKKERHIPLALHSLTLDDIGPHSTHADEHTTEVIAILLASEESTMSADPSVAWDKTLVSAIINNTVSFIRRCSVINVLRVETTTSKRWQAAVGSGEDTSMSIVVRTRLTFRCMHHIISCTFASAVTLAALRDHKVLCPHSIKQDGAVSSGNKPVRDAAKRASQGSPAKKTQKAP